MFPGLDVMLEAQRDGVIRWYTDILEDALQERWEGFLKACTVDNKPVGFCAWTIEEYGEQKVRKQVQTNETQSGPDSNVGEKRERERWEPDTLDVKSWISLSKQLRMERERVLGDLSHICRKLTLERHRAH